MKKILLPVIIATTLSLVSVNLFAAGPLPANKINAVAFQSVGFFLYAEGWSNPNSCTRTNAVVLLDTDINYDKAYSLLLTAYTAGKTVSGYSNGCVEVDGQTYNTIRGYKYLVVQ